MLNMYVQAYVKHMLNICLHDRVRTGSFICQCNIFLRNEIFILLSLITFRNFRNFTNKNSNTCLSFDQQEFYFILSLVHILFKLSITLPVLTLK